MITIHTDGGSRGNPGPAASAFILEMDGKTIYKGTKYLGIATNNIAEYTAVLLALEWFIDNMLNKLPDQSVSFVLDSELVVKQLNGIYKVKDQSLKKIFSKILENIKFTKLKINFTHVPREKNKQADSLVNQELDSHR